MAIDEKVKDSFEKRKTDNNYQLYITFSTNHKNVNIPKWLKEKYPREITIVLENIFQARNIAASIRSADCFGIQDVHVIENHNAFQHDPEVSMGAEKWITLKRYNEKKHNSVETIKHLKDKGYQIIATTPHNTDSDLYSLDIIKNKTALLFGSEITGCTKKH